MNDNRLRRRITGLFLFVLVSLSVVVYANRQTRGTANDKQAIVDLEQEWLNAHDAATLDRILAPDFVHPLPSGEFISKQQQIAWAVDHQPPAGVHSTFADLRVRIYGDVGIANGSVIKTKQGGSEVSKTVFTDVFVFRDRRWQAVNAQENLVQR